MERSPTDFNPYRCRVALVFWGAHRGQVAGTMIEADRIMHGGHVAMTPEVFRLKAAQERTAHWRRWGPYLSERQWGTVREDYTLSLHDALPI